MGAGKTLEMLALVLLTRGRPALVEAAMHELDPACVRTDLIEPRAVGRELDTLADPNNSLLNSESSINITVPSLSDLLVDWMRRDPAFSREDIAAASTTSAALHAYDTSPAYYFQRPKRPSGSSRTRRTVPPSDASQPIYLASTLCVVPSTLTTQWRDEIDTHIATGALNTLYITEGKDDIPDPRQLSQFDLVVISLGRFQLASKRLFDARCACNLPLVHASRTERCACAVSCMKADACPLLFCHWERLVVDEGHVLGTHASLVVQLCHQMHATSRWIVSGTPTSTLRSVDAQEGAAPSTPDSDHADLCRLANIAKFLRCPPFQIVDFQDSMTRPFLRKEAGSAARITAFLERIVVRNREAVVLPPKISRVHRLAFENLTRLTYNTLVALFSLNSILSERTDQDFLFHPRQRRALHQMLMNLENAQLWLSSPDTLAAVQTALYNIRDEVTCASKESYEAKNKRRSADDRILLEQSILALQTAADDADWRQVMESGSLPFEVDMLDQEILHAWGLSASLVCPAQRARVPMLGCERILQARAALNEALKVPGLTSADLAEELKTVGLTTKSKCKDNQDSRRKNVQNILKGVRKNLRDDRPRQPFPDAAFSRPLIKRACSPKINFIVEEILKSPVEDKFLIFTSSKAAIYYLAESLDLVGIPNLLYVSEGIDGQKRSEHVRLFQNKDNSTERVLILQLSLGSRGLNLQAANRVIFLSPVWQPDVEAQAVKRALRLGQSRPVIVDTLVMADSFEDHLLQRRELLAGEALQAAAAPVDDSQLRTLLTASALFVSEQVNENQSNWNLPLFPEGRLLPHYLQEKHPRVDGTPPLDYSTGSSSVDNSPETPQIGAFVPWEPVGVQEKPENVEADRDS